MKKVVTRLPDEDGSEAARRLATVPNGRTRNHVARRSANPRTPRPSRSRRHTVVPGRSKPRWSKLLPLAVLAVAGPTIVMASTPSMPLVIHSDTDVTAIWSEVGPDATRMPEITIAKPIYPTSKGVQFRVDGQIYELNKTARPNGYDKTGPADGSVFQLYPALKLTPGTQIEARWEDGKRNEHRSTYKVKSVEQFYTLGGADVATWSDVAAGNKATPTIVIADATYPDAHGVQFAINDKVDERCKCRPEGYDTTGPQDASDFHIYPKMTPQLGQQIEARWIDRTGRAYRTVYTIGAGQTEAAPATTPATTNAPATTTATTAPVLTAPPVIVVEAPATTAVPVVVTLPPPETTVAPPETTVAPPETTVAPPQDAADGDAGSLASWLDSTSGSGRQPTVVVDGSIYPNSSGVQFLVNGKVDERCSCRPNGYDTTGPQEGSKYHIYPDITLVGGDVVEARWTDRGGKERSSEVIVAGTAQVASTPTATTTAPAQSPTPLSGERPASHNTGHDGNLTRTFGSTTITQSWLNANNGGSRLLENVRFTGQVSVYVDDLTIRNFEVTGGKYGVFNDVFSGNPSTGLVLEDGELTRSSSSGLLVSNAIARRLHIHDQGTDAIKPFSNVTIEDSYIHDIGYIVGGHADGVQMVSGSNVTFRGNNFDMPTNTGGYINAICLIIHADNGPVSNITIDGNWINGGTYSLNIKDRGHGFPSNVQITNNRFGRGALYGPVTYGGGSPDVVTGNVWDDTGSPI